MEICGALPEDLACVILRVSTSSRQGSLPTRCSIPRRCYLLESMLLARLVLVVATAAGLLHRRHRLFVFTAWVVVDAAARGRYPLSGIAQLLLP